MDQSRLYIFENQFDDYVIGSFNPLTGAQQWALKFDDDGLGVPIDKFK
jgi:hypothetical protein